jgi:SAM-dependent methyltransferase
MNAFSSDMPHVMHKNAYGLSKDSVFYWANNRNSYEDLYKSERIFFDEVLQGSSSVLDVGCAAGGLYDIISRRYDSDYIGIDVSPELVNEAQQKYGADFRVYDGENIPIENASCDLVISFGVMHHLPHWKAMINELIRVAKKSVLFDVRLSHSIDSNESRVYEQHMGFGGEKSSFAIPYIVLSFEEFYEYLTDICSSHGLSFESYGYFCKPTPLSNVDLAEVFMCSILIKSCF